MQKFIVLFLIFLTEVSNLLMTRQLFQQHFNMALRDDQHVNLEWTARKKGKNIRLKYYLVCVEIFLETRCYQWNCKKVINDSMNFLISIYLIRYKHVNSKYYINHLIKNIAYVVLSYIKSYKCQQDFYIFVWYKIMYCNNMPKRITQQQSNSPFLPTEATFHVQTYMQCLLFWVL